MGMGTGTVCCISKFATLSLSNIIRSRLPSATSMNFSLASSSFSSFTWDDVFRIPESQSTTQDRSRYLQGFSHKVQLCNHASEKQSEFLPFVIEDHIVGFIHNGDIHGHRYKRDVAFCYDLKLPKSFLPKNEDGEVDSFKLIPVTQVAEVIRNTEFFKPNCSLVIIDFLFRHGYITPEYLGYLDLLRNLRIGDCS